jgi:hypothetical protein
VVLTCDADYIDMLGPGHVPFDRDGGHIESVAVQLGLLNRLRCCSGANEQAVEASPPAARPPPPNCCAWHTVERMDQARWRQ